MGEGSAHGTGAFLVLLAQHPLAVLKWVMQACECVVPQGLCVKGLGLMLCSPHPEILCSF